MMLGTQGVSVGLLADNPHLLAEVGQMRFRAFGEPVKEGLWGLDGQITIAKMEAGRETLPITWVAVDRENHAVGCIGMLPGSDLPNRPELSPSLGGMVVHEKFRGRGIGRCLLTTVQDWASDHDIAKLWVVTGENARDFYQRCGWTVFDEMMLTWSNVDITEKVWVLNTDL